MEARVPVPEQPTWLFRLLAWVLRHVNSWAHKHLERLTKDWLREASEAAITLPKRWVEDQISQIRDSVLDLPRRRAAERDARWRATASERLVSVLTDPPAGYSEFSFSGLYKNVRPPTPEWLAEALVSATPAMSGWRPVFRVRAPGSDWIRDFTWLDEVPPRLTEPGKRPFDVDPSCITVVLTRL